MILSGKMPDTNDLARMVTSPGLEPGRPAGLGILSAVRLPISPRGLPVANTHRFPFPLRLGNGGARSGKILGLTPGYFATTSMSRSSVALTLKVVW